MLERREVEWAHLESLFRLKVTDDQDTQVAPTEITLAQQAYRPGSAVWGLWDGETAVGLLAMIHPKKRIDPNEGDDPEAAYIWRLLISAEYQGKGYGRAAIAEAATVAREWDLSRICLTCVDRPGGAEGFYTNLGFARTGRIFDDECEMTRTASGG